MQACRHIVRVSRWRQGYANQAAATDTSAGESLEKFSDDGLVTVGERQTRGRLPAYLARTKFWSDSELAIPGDEAESLVGLPVFVNDRVAPRVTHVVEHADNDLKTLVSDDRP